MTCDFPIRAFYSRTVNPSSGKRSIVFNPGHSLSGSRMQLPCGKCAGCRLERSRRWAIRIMHESKMHAQNSFITLTYSNENLPHVGTLVPDHLQVFHKKLHKALVRLRGFGIRYYGCGEYGSINCRPHYHSILFGFDFPDKVIYSKNGKGQTIWRSNSLDNIWGHGECKIGEVSYESAAYVARYCMKKVDGAKRELGHYEVYDADGIIHERVPEFSHMSRRPGIGTPYWLKYGQEIATHDSIVVDGKSVPSIRYYDDKIKALDPAKLELIKKKRRRKAIWRERLIDRRLVKEKLRAMQSKTKVRPV